MNDHPPSPEAGVEPDRGAKPGMPRWVKVFVIIAVVLIVVVVIGLVTGQLGPGGPHGPGRHLGARSNATSARVALEVACHQQGHYEAGMRGPVTVI